MSAAAGKLIQAVEEQLATLYRFPLVTSAVPFLMKSEQFERTGEARAPRAAVFFTQTSDTLDIGIFIDPELLDTLDAYDPKIQLSSHNLDAYCVLIEELSHFHLLLQRSEEGRGISQLELEWQGEIDKLLIAGLLMSEQRQTSCFQNLHRLIFEEGVLISQDPVYQEASHYAAKCWHRLLPKSQRLTDVRGHVLPILQKAYKANWDHKFRIIRDL
ncbi:MAG: hypothetical protein H7249_18350 [Chitinophagaceae bacterium]|nr:hypothetical protein [Oligoflexus sp.]